MSSNDLSLCSDKSIADGSLTINKSVDELLRFLNVGNSFGSFEMSSENTICRLDFTRQSLSGQFVHNLL